jgi:amino acid adenylation domain-containing protein
MKSELLYCKLGFSQRSPEFNEPTLDDSIISRFNSIVKSFADRKAIELPDRTVTYLELDDLSDKVADYLIQKFNVKQRGFAVLVDDELSFYTSILGILKSGNYYIPIEPSFPEERISYILSDLNPKSTIIGDKNFDFLCIKSDNFPVITIKKILAEKYERQVKPAILSSDSAFIIYTSGTTGHPKGVVQSHRNVIHNCAIQSEIYNISPDDKFSQLHAKSVMGAVRATYNALLNGACLCPFNVKASNFTELSQWLVAMELSVFHLSSSVFRSFVGKVKNKTCFDSIRLVILGGEAVKESDLVLYRNLFSDNCYFCTGLGSTETCTTRMLILNKQSKPIFYSGLLPLGFAINGMEITLEDEHGNLVEDGEIGEITVNSQYLARGYWDSTKNTFETFVQKSRNTSQPYSYGTGDLGYLRPDNCLVHMGRKDHQVKIRGNRIEVREIEVAIESISYISQAIVISSTLHQEIILSVFLVFHDCHSLVKDEIKDLLRKKLPEHMIPYHFFLLENIPLTSNGKIDYVHLQKLNEEQNQEITSGGERDSSKNVFNKSTNFHEKRVRLLLAECFDKANVLSLRDQSLRNEFLTEGSHIQLKELDIDSLATMEICIDIEEKIGISIDLKELVATKTVSQLVHLLLSQESIIESDRKYIQISENDKSLFPLKGIIKRSQKWRRKFFKKSRNRWQSIMPHRTLDQLPDSKEGLGSSKEIYDEYISVSKKCRSSNQLRKIQISLENIITPSEVEYFHSAILETEPVNSKHQEWIKKFHVEYNFFKKSTPEEFFRKKMVDHIYFYGDKFDPKEKTLLICFSGNAQRMMMPLPFFLQQLDARETDVLLIRDPTRNGYRTGIKGISNSIEAVIDQITHLLDISQYKRTAAIGTSGGGFPALLSAMRLGLDASLSVGSCGPYDSRWKKLSDSSAFDMIIKNYRSQEKHPNINLCYGTKSSLDHKSALEISQLISAHIIPIENAGHVALPSIRLTGGLNKLLTETIFN